MLRRIRDMLRLSDPQAYSRLGGGTATYLRRKRWRLSTIIKWSLLAIILGAIVFLAVFSVQLNVRIYIRNWLSHSEDAYYGDLGGCFDELPKDSPYIQGTSEYVYDITPGVALLDGYDCYEFAATIQPIPENHGNASSKSIYHAYWRADLAPVGPKQLAALRSFFATQNENSILYLWSNGDLGVSPVIQDIKAHVGDRLEIKLYDARELSKGTPMEASPHLDFNDQYGYLDGDLIRLLVIYRYGGMWFDMDSLLIRDMSPLFEHEWLSQWDCFQPNGFPFNGAFMHFKQKSPYLCEMLSEMANGPLPRKGTIDWGGYLYYRIYRRLLHHGIKPWSVVPWCFTDPMVCKPSNSMPNAFIETDFPRDRLLQIFAYHWHNQWKKEPGSLFLFLENIHKNITGW